MIQKGFPDMLKFYIATYWTELLLMFFACFAIGMLLALSTCFYNREKKKKGYRTKQMRGADKELDERMYQEFKEHQQKQSAYLKDSMEHHANKKFL